MQNDEARSTGDDRAAADAAASTPRKLAAAAVADGVLPADQVPDAQRDVITVAGIVSARTLTPLVSIIWNGERGQVTPAEAAGHAQIVQRESWFAFSDAALAQMLRSRLEFDLAGVHAFLNEFRHVRAELLDAGDRELRERMQARYQEWAAGELAARRAAGANVHGIGPDTDGGPNPDHKGGARA